MYAMPTPTPQSVFPRSAALPPVDTHFHVFPAHQSTPGARYIPAYAAPLQAWQTAAAAVGLRHGVLVQTSFMGTDNRLLLAQLAQHPDSLRGVAVVSPDASLPALQALHAQGVRGIRLNLAGQSHDMAPWAGASPLWDALLALGWHVELHTDRGALDPVLAALPLAVPVVVDHFGKPERASLHDASIAAVLQRSRQAGAATAHVKLSAAYRLAPGIDAAALARLWLQELGPQALLWGSDWPCTNHEDSADYPALYAALAGWLGPENTEALEAIRCTTPWRLYWGTPQPA
ncbi:Predicted metal-dependent hydrolase, TIM-barrel fold [Rhodoferax sp. OV413]|nr:Predicted metal-dependent hydrolase, TIM-barrel fold [Rhodoferax sp. OV413]